LEAEAVEAEAIGVEVEAVDEIAASTSLVQSRVNDSLFTDAIGEPLAHKF